MKSTLWLVAIVSSMAFALESRAQTPLQLNAHAQLPGTYPKPDFQNCESGKYCATECKPTTKTVYGSISKEYCAPGCSLFGLLKSCCGSDSDGNCGQVRTRNVLIKKVAPGPTVNACVLKELPIEPTNPKKLSTDGR